ncbi:hypothetical protein FKP32DRAFT_266785 [Trametes sanguinea]|nr:hypothetical protein FKP32DRAFT_266785 [Trametes sanguinea]
MPHPCSICDSLAFHGYPEESTHDFLSGEVFRVVESIATPIEEILSHSHPTVDLARRQPSTTSLQSINSKTRATHKSARPCILLNDYITTRIQDIRRPRVCLMATFEGCRMVTLPRILQFFCIAVHPTIPLDDTHVKKENLPPSTNIHLHSLLPWPPTEKCDMARCAQPCEEVHCNQWIIAWSFRTKRPLLGRWLTPEANRKRQAAMRNSMSGEYAASYDLHEIDSGAEGERTGMVFGESAYAVLLQHCISRRKAWIDLCRADPTFIAERESQYREWFKEHDAELARQRLAQSEASLSMRSRPRHPHPASLLAGSLLSQIIPEEDVSMCEELKGETSAGQWVTVDTVCRQRRVRSKCDRY